jgi:hypothetical protein
VPAFADFLVEASAFLGGVSRYFYVQEAVPSSTDHEIVQICHAVAAAGPSRTPEFAAVLDNHKKTVLGIFGQRAAQIVLATTTPDGERSEILADALVAEALSNVGHRDFRDVLVGLALHYECAHRLKLNTTDVFDAAAVYADPDTAALMRIFGRRQDVTLKRFGWNEVPGATGPTFESE